MKNRPARVRELIQRELGAIVMHEMNFTQLVTIQAVDLTADFKHCHVHVGVLGTERQQLDAIHALAERRPHLQHELSKRVILKYTPALHFHLDHSVERGTKVMEIMRQIDEITPPAEAEDEDAPMTAQAAKDAADMATEETQQEEAARHQVEEDGADDEQDALFEETFTPSGDEEKPAAAKSDRGSRNAKLRAAHDSDAIDE